MKKYLELFKDGFDETISEKIKPENWPYVGYSPSEGVKFTSISRPTCFVYTTSDGSLFDLQGILDFWISLSESNNTKVSLGASVTSNTYNDMGKIVLNTTIDRLGLSEDNILFPIFTTSIFGNNEDPYNITKLTSVELPDTITHIADGTFYSCTGLQHVTLPKGLININPSVFYSCTALQDINIPNGIISIGNSAFDGCSSLTSIAIPNSVTSIGENTFSDCSSLTSITIPNSVTSIGDFAFSDCTSLKNVVIGSSVSSDYYQGANGAWFLNCPNIESIIVEEGNPRYDSRDNCNAIVETRYNAIKQGCKNTKIADSIETVYSDAFKGITMDYLYVGKSIKTVESWPEVTNIHIEANNSNLALPYTLTTCTFGKDVETLPNLNNTSITQLVIPPKIQKISNIKNCKKLTEIFIPRSVTTIVFVALSGCTSLQTINYEGTTAEWGLITLGSNWNKNVPATYVQCSDGQVTL